MTNFEKIKAMSVEEMREFLCKLLDCSICRFGPWGCTLMEWLESEVEEDG